MCQTQASDHPLVTAVQLTLPSWIASMVDPAARYPTDDDKMRLAIALARRNVAEQSGGPFGAAIFDAASHSVISVGVNRVVPMTNSTAHAEMMAFMCAQARLGTFRLDNLQRPFVLATSAQPCAMCYGASVWAGINRMIIGARTEDVESLTEFDEGPLPADWRHGLTSRGITVTTDVLRDQAVEVLRAYSQGGGTRY
jgi:tRNA(Arg) A34 adenosine deaminase TadA